MNDDAILDLADAIRKVRTMAHRRNSTTAYWKDLRSYKTATLVLHRTTEGSPTFWQDTVQIDASSKILEAAEKIALEKMEEDFQKAVDSLQRHRRLAENL